MSHDDWETLIRKGNFINDSWLSVRVDEVVYPDMFIWMQDHCTGQYSNWGKYFFFEKSFDKAAFWLVWV